ncbi:MAG: YdhR family protein [Pseudomonadota bacterium]
MITAIVEFKLSQKISVRKAREIFLSTAEKYKGLPGLIRKYYLISPDGDKAGGIYLWKTREDADRLYTDEWKAFVRGKYGSEPKVNYLETPVIVDNLSNEIITGE